MSAPHFVSPEVIDRFEDPCPSRHFGSADYLPPSRLTQEAIDYEVRQVEEEAERMAALRLAAIFTVFSIIGGVMAFGLLIAAVCTASH